MRNKIFLILCSILLVGVSTALSHGLGRQVVEQEVVGPYTVSVWVEPEAVQPGDEVHITISLQNDTATMFVTTASLAITAEPPDEIAEPLTSTAIIGGSANPLFYEGLLELADVGEWTIRIVITGAEGAAEVEFALEVGGDSSSGDSEVSNLRDLGQVLGLIGIGIVTLAVIFQALRQRVKE
ncbi:MAG: hypothetical protein L0154_24245 [Chloroflexi bacterium]|nr:hypothetical protein [Chloroflexota bacterium]